MAAVAIGVCLGLMLFGKVVSMEMQQELHDVFRPSVTTTSTPAP